MSRLGIGGDDPDFELPCRKDRRDEEVAQTVDKIVDPQAAVLLLQTSDSCSRLWKRMRTEKNFVE